MYANAESLGNRRSLQLAIAVLWLLAGSLPPACRRVGAPRSPSGSSVPHRRGSRRLIAHVLRQSRERLQVHLQRRRYVCDVVGGNGKYLLQRLVLPWPVLPVLLRQAAVLHHALDIKQRCSPFPPSHSARDQSSRAVGPRCSSRSSATLWCLRNSLGIPHSAFMLHDAIPLAAYES